MCIRDRREDIQSRPETDCVVLTLLSEWISGCRNGSSVPTLSSCQKVLQPAWCLVRHLPTLFYTFKDTFDDVRKYSGILPDLAGFSTASDSIEDIAYKIAAAVLPE